MRRGLVHRRLADLVAWAIQMRIGPADGLAHGGALSQYCRVTMSSIVVA